MALRVFTCRECGHRMRYGARRCGNCYAPTPGSNRVRTLILGLGLLAVAAGVLVVA
jgi:hypothetical protein